MTVETDGSHRLQLMFIFNTAEGLTECSETLLFLALYSYSYLTMAESSLGHLPADL